MTDVRAFHNIVCIDLPCPKCLKYGATVLDINKTDTVYVCGKCQCEFIVGYIPIDKGRLQVITKIAEVTS